MAVDWQKLAQEMGAAYYLFALAQNKGEQVDALNRLREGAQAIAAASSEDQHGDA